MFKGQAGITLVALVITIIVLLILAGVTISLLLDEDSGILKYATEGAENYTLAAEEENRLLQNVETFIEEYVEGMGIDATSPATGDAE